MKALVVGRWRCGVCGADLFEVGVGVLEHPDMWNETVVLCKWNARQFEQPWEELEEFTRKSETHVRVSQEKA